MSDELIKEFKKHKYCQKSQLIPLEISQDEWLSLAKQFKEENRHVVTEDFFISTLSHIRDVQPEILLKTIYPQREQPKREAKRTIALEDKENHPIKKPKRFYQKDDGINKFFFNNSEGNPNLQKKLKDKGVRITDLYPATPQQGYPNMMKTSSNRKLRPLCETNRYSLYQEDTPTKLAKSGINKERLDSLPPERSRTMEFTTRHEDVEKAYKKPRGRSAKSIKGDMSAKDKLEAQGRPTPNAVYQHIKAHCVGGPQQADNLFPGTSQSNYYAFQTSESHILDLLIDKKTDAVDSRVELLCKENIPVLQTYTSKWVEKLDNQSYNETFYFKPQSTSRLTKREYASIKILREEAKEKDLVEYKPK